MMQLELIISLMSLPYFFGTRTDTIPAEISYLTPKPVKLGFNFLPYAHKLKIGISWAGDPKFKNDFARSMRLKDLRAIFDIPNAEIFSLQKGSMKRQWGDKQIDLLKNTEDMIYHDLAPVLTDYNRTANAIKEMDAVVSVDTSVAHLAGAIGTKVFTLLPHHVDPRWLLSRSDSPWYPTMTLCRKNALGEAWEAVAGRAAQLLATKANA